jgi:Tfp pilus assembly protein FimT
MSGEGASAGAVTPLFTTASSQRAATPAVSPERAAEITTWANRTTAKAEHEFKENRVEWTNQEYGKLLAKEGGRLEFRPDGATDDRKSHLMRAAEHLVKRNHAARLAGINRAAEKLLAGETLERKTKEIGR